MVSRGGSIVVTPDSSVVSVSLRRKTDNMLEISPPEQYNSCYQGLLPPISTTPIMRFIKKGGVRMFSEEPDSSRDTVLLSSAPHMADGILNNNT